MMAQNIPEFSRLRPAINLPLDGRPFVAKASVEECRALAGRFGIIEVAKLNVEGVLRPRSKGRQVVVSATLTATVTQACVITTEPVRQTIHTLFERRFDLGIADDWARFSAGGGDLLLSDSDMDAADPLTGDTIDVGEIAAEQLALELNPFPRAPGAVFSSPSPPRERTAVENDHPFAVLEQLRKQD